MFWEKKESRKQSNRRMDAKLALLAAALLTSGLLTGCSSDDPSQNKELEPGLTTGAEWQQLKKVDALEMVLNETGDGGLVISLPQFVVEEDAVTAEAFADFNADLQDKVEEWQAWLDNRPEGEAARVITYAMDTENYLSVLVTEQRVYEENAENEVSCYVFDKIVERAMDADMAMTLAGADDDMIAAALDDYISSSDYEGEARWSAFSVDAYAMDENEQAVLYIGATVVIKDEEGNKERRQEIFVMKGGEIIGRLVM